MNDDFVPSFRQLEMFQDLPAQDLEKFLAECRFESLDSQAVIFREGDAPDRFYILLEGHVEIWKDFGTSVADILAIRGPGACFGEMALIDDLPRSATVVTATPVRLVSLGQPHFRQVIEQNPTVALLIMKTVSQLVRISNETFQNGLIEKNLMLERAYDDLQKAQENLLRAERLSTVGKFASMIIHDLRNPLSIVKGYAEILATTQPTPERTNQMARKLLGEAERLNQMLGELLDYSRGNIRLNLSPVLLEHLFDRIHEESLPALTARQGRLEVVNLVLEPLLLDANRIHRVLTNLVENARKALRPGGWVRLEARVDGERIVITVTDNGEGMDEATQARLFEPFFSASGSGGTGLGLLIVANVVEAHQGLVAVVSEKGKGTKVTIHLPLHMGGSR